MSDPMEEQSTEGGEALGSTTGNVNKGKRKEFKERSEIWAHYDKYKDVNGKVRELCKYCKISNYSGDTTHGTSNLWSHNRKYHFNPNREDITQTHLELNSLNDVETGERKVCLQVGKFNQEKARRTIAEMLIIDELPFKFVDNEGYRRSMKICAPLVFVLTRTTIRKDCYELYLDEKKKLKAQLKKTTLRVCLTTDTWTSLQRVNYMCLTAHYIDNYWKLQKKVINFSTITSHRGTDIGRDVENCLIEWGLKNILTITVDNASSNDTTIDYLKGKLVKWGDNCILKGKWTHVRCFAHILNLVVQEGLKERGISVDRIREVVRWIRISPARIKKFREYCILDNVECEKSLVIDVPTRWNSTYLMLSVAIEYERVFDRFAEEDYVYRRDLREGDGREFEDGKKEGPPGIPGSNDWANARLLVVFLKHFYDMTLRVSGTKYITSNSYLESINCLDTILKRCFLTDDNDLKSMSVEMIKKFDKYWGDTKKFNMLVFIASVFDPRTKLEYLKVNLCSMYGSEEGNEDGNQVVTLCKIALKELFNDYKRIYSDQHIKNVTSSSQVSHNYSSNVECSNTGAFSVFEDTIETMRKKNMAEVKRRKAVSGTAKETKTELDRYLTEEIEGDNAYFESDNFTVLGWLKKRGPAFPILSLVARDILAIHISTVASESTFSTGGRVLDSFRTSSTPQIVEALICFQDWIRTSRVPINVEEKIEDLEKFEEEMRNISIESSADME